jgi:Zn finger protein HypA/HybF involved in hydrogenase expression
MERVRVQCGNCKNKWTQNIADEKDKREWRSTVPLICPECKSSAVTRI